MVTTVEETLQPRWQTEGHEGLREPGHCRIVVLGVGGAGNNTVSRLMEMGVVGAECVAINTDMQHLDATRATYKILIGEKTTRGFGTGGNPALGRTAIEESRRQIEDLLTGVDMAFVTAGLGGGTGTGAAPFVAKCARLKGATVVGVVTTPFRIEKGRMGYASLGLNEMRRECDALIIIDNNKLLELVPNLPINEAFKVADKVLANMIKGIVETISSPSLINLDLADFKTIMEKGGLAIVGVGESDAPNRAEESVRNALRKPLLDVDYAEATGALIHVSGDDQMTIEEANRAGEIVTEMMRDDALVIWGARVNPSLTGNLKVTLIITGMNTPKIPSELETIMAQIIDMEPHAEPERPLSVDLGLYQMENFEC